MPRKAGGKVETRNGVNGPDDGHRVGRHVDKARPVVRNPRVGKSRKNGGEIGEALPIEVLRSGRVQDAHPFEGACLIQSPAARGTPFLKEASADPYPNLVPLPNEHRREVGEQPEAVGHDGRDIGIAHGNGESAVQPLAERKVGAAHGHVRHTVDAFDARYRTQHLQLRKVDAEISGKQPRPRPAGQNGCRAGNGSAFGDDAVNPPGRHIDAAHRAAGENLGAMAPRAVGDRRRRDRRFGATVAPRMKTGQEALLATRNTLGQVVTPQEARVQVVLSGVAEPILVFRHFPLRGAQIDDTGLAVAGIGTHPLSHLLP